MTTRDKRLVNNPNRLDRLKQPMDLVPGIGAIDLDFDRPLSDEEIAQMELTGISPVPCLVSTY
jgi:hypothetical protein